MNGEFQQLLLNEIETKLGKKISLVECISSNLSISTDSAYRRISGKTAISFEEAVKLAEALGISFDTLLEKDRGTITFERRSTLKTENDIAIHLKEMVEMMRLQVSLGKEKAIYSTKDIPIFYHFFFPELGAFKVYCWHRALNTSEEISEAFDPKKYMNSYSNLFNEIRELYSKVPAIELWSEVAVLGFIRQLRYYFDSDLMGSKETALLLIDQHLEVFKLVKEQARIGKKIIETEKGTLPTVDYELYFNELFVMDNAVMANLGDRKVFFNSYAYFNYIPTHDQKFCSDVEMWLQNQMKRSVKLSQSRDKERNQFFKNIEKELLEIKQYIQAN